MKEKFRNTKPSKPSKLVVLGALLATLPMVHAADTAASKDVSAAVDAAKAVRQAVEAVSG